MGESFKKQLSSRCLLVFLSATISLVQSIKKSEMMEATFKPEKEIMVGGWQEVDPQRDDIQKLLPQVMTKLNQQSNDAYHLMPINVRKAAVQVVAGINYNLEIQVARTSCKKSASNADIDLTKCSKLEGHPDQVLKVNAWHKPWEDFLQVNILETKILEK